MGTINRYDLDAPFGSKDIEWMPQSTLAVMLLFFTRILLIIYNYVFYQRTFDCRRPTTIHWWSVVVSTWTCDLTTSQRPFIFVRLSWKIYVLRCYLA